MKKIKTIALIAPSGNIRDWNAIKPKIELLAKKFKIKKYYDENSSFNYLSDTDEKRAQYFIDALKDNETDMVIPLRGGFGAIRIVDKIDYNKIKNCSKYFIGSSDCSILLASLYKKTKVKLFHSLMISNGFVDNLKKNIEIIENSIFDINLEPIKKGKAKGVLWGGNLSSIASLLSNDNYLTNKDIILFLEDLNEPVYKIDKMIFEIYRNKKLKEKIRGIIFGDFYFEKKEIMPLLKNYSELFNIPSFLSFDITHKKNNVTIPYGIEICLDS